MPATTSRGVFARRRLTTGLPIDDRSMRLFTLSCNGIATLQTLPVPVQLALDSARGHAEDLGDRRLLVALGGEEDDRLRLLIHVACEAGDQLAVDQSFTRDHRRGGVMRGEVEPNAGGDAVLAALGQCPVPEGIAELEKCLTYEVRLEAGPSGGDPLARDQHLRAELLDGGADRVLCEVGDLVLARDGAPVVEHDAEGDATLGA